MYYYFFTCSLRPQRHSYHHEQHVSNSSQTLSPASQHQIDETLVSLSALFSNDMREAAS